MGGAVAGIFAEHAIQGIDQLDRRGRIGGTSRFCGGVKMQAKQGSGPAYGNDAGFHIGEPSSNAFAEETLSHVFDD